MTITYTDYINAEHHIFPLHRIIDGNCECGNPHCKAVGKHPIMSNWQYITTWDEEQLATLEDDYNLRGYNQLADGFGVNLHGRNLLVVDIDARNGGVQSAAKLAPILMSCTFVVQTGSGNGSKHYYFYIPEAWRGKALKAHLDITPGIDFKSTGFVVGCGSLHKSGARYEALIGSPGEIGDAPESLLQMLLIPERQREVFEGRTIEYSHDELANIVMSISNTGRDYEKWIRVGMGIHHATGGTGYDLWCQWSAKCKEAHDDTDMPLKWGSFGRSASSVTVGTLITWAKQDGYEDPVSFTDDTDWEPINEQSLPETTAGINLLRPPGLVGEIAAWINRRSLFPREYLAVAGALQIVSNAASLRYRVAGYKTSLNLMTFGVAGSGSGKGNVLDCMQECQEAAGLGMATHGGVKSEQEILRNAMRHQAVMYKIDEVGMLLSKLGNARKSGGRTPYLEAVPATIMSMFSAANSTYAITGDLKEEMRELVEKDLAKASKALEAKGGAELEAIVEDLLRQKEAAKNGLKNPIMSFFGVAEPGQFNDAVNGDKWLLTGGFLGRALVFEEPDSMPRRKNIADVSHERVPDGIVMTLSTLYNDGHAGANNERVELRGDIKYISMTKSAEAEYDRVYEYWHQRGLKERDDGSGLEALAIRAPELTLKIAATLSMGEMVITQEHILWAHALTKKVNNLKISKARAIEGADSKDKEEKQNGILEAIHSVLSQGEYHTIGVIAGRYRNKFTKEQLQAGLDHLVTIGKVIRAEVKDTRNRNQVRYSLSKNI